MPRVDRIRGAAAVIAAIAAATPFANASAQATWSVEARTEPSAVDISGRAQTWWTRRLQVDYRDPAVFGFFLAGETQRRGSGNNEVALAGGFRRLGDWTVRGEVGLGVEPVYVPRLSVHCELSRRIAGTLAAQVGYRYVRLPAARVAIWSPGAIYYFPHGEVEVRADLGRNQTSGHDIRVFILRSLWDDGSAFSWGAGAAVGRSLFDAIAAPGAGESGWIVFANVRYRIDARNGLRLDLGAGQEEPAFRQRSLALSYRRSF